MLCTNANNLQVTWVEQHSGKRLEPRKEQNSCGLVVLKIVYFTNLVFYFVLFYSVVFDLFYIIKYIILQYIEPILNFTQRIILVWHNDTLTLLKKWYNYKCITQHIANISINNSQWPSQPTVLEQNSIWHPPVVLYWMCILAVYQVMQ